MRLDENNILTELPDRMKAIAHTAVDEAIWRQLVAKLPGMTKTDNSQIL